MATAHRANVRLSAAFRTIGVFFATINQTRSRGGGPEKVIE